jgi:sec-independent protein translocase protein TatC
MTDKTTNQTADQGEQPFLSHLFELRDRLLRIVMVVGLIFVVLFYFANDLYTLLADPLLRYLPSGKMQAIDVITPIFTPLKLALVTSIFLGMPFILFQIWRFVAPGLYEHEKKLAVPLIVSSILLFYAGMAFAYFVVFPLVFEFLAQFVPAGVEMATDIARYLDFVLKMFFAFGVAFEVPIATILVIAAGMTTPEKLAKKRPYIIVAAFTLGMLLTPPDIISQVMLALPMWVLFEAGIFFAKIMFKERLEARAREEAELDEDLSEEDMDAELDRAIAEEESLNREK